MYVYYFFVITGGTWRHVIREEWNGGTPYRCLGSTGIIATVKPRQRNEGYAFLLAKTCGHATEVDIAIDRSGSRSPFKATEK